MAVDYMKAIYLLAFVKTVDSDIAFQWTEVNIDGTVLNWKPTSFEYSNHKFYMTFIDINKTTPGIGVVGWFAQEDHPSPKLKIHGRAEDYMFFSPHGSIKAPLLVRVDPCEDIWVMDGNMYDMSGIQKKNKPLFHIYDGKKKTVSRFQDGEWDENFVFTNLIFDVIKAEVKNSEYCGALVAYISDYRTFNLLSYHYHEDTTREDNSLNYNNFKRDVRTYEMFTHITADSKLGGISGLTLSRTDEYGSLLFFHNSESTFEYASPADGSSNVLRPNFSDIRITYDKGPDTEAARSAYDPETETFFFAEIKTNRIGCLNLRSIMEGRTSTLAYGRFDIDLKQGVIVDLKVIQDELWILTASASDVSLRKEFIPSITEKAQCKYPPYNQTCKNGECLRRDLRNGSSIFDFNMLLTISLLLFIKVFFTREMV